MSKKLIILTILSFMLSCTPTVVKKEAPAPKPVPKVSAWFEGFIITDGTNIREEPSLRASVIAQADDGEKVQVLKNDNGWYEVLTANNNQGWIRSDFVGTAELSYAVRASDFVDSTLKKYDTELFIDEDDPYHVIYMVLPEKYYANKSHARRYADEIGRLYQEQVYSGEVIIRILQQDKENLYTRSILPKKGATFVKAPYLKFGRVFSVDLNQYAIQIRTLIPAGLKDDDLAEMAYEITSRYGDQIQKIEVWFVEDSAEGIKYYTQDNYTPAIPAVCRLYFLEDSQGPLFKKNFCTEK